MEKSNYGRNCYYELPKTLTTQFIKKMKAIQHETLIRPVPLRASEIRCSTQQQKRLFSAFEWELVRNIIGAVEDEAWQIRYNTELHRLFKELTNEELRRIVHQK